MFMSSLYLKIILAMFNKCPVHGNKCKDFFWFTDNIFLVDVNV